MTWVMYETSVGTSWSIDEVRDCCRTSPSNSVRRLRSAGSSTVSIHGPSGQNESWPLARVHCPSAFCWSRAVTSLPQV